MVFIYPADMNMSSLYTSVAAAWRLLSIGLPFEASRSPSIKPIFNLSQLVGPPVLHQQRQHVIGEPQQLAAA